MKELSIEQKARRYDEAIERVENIKTGKCETTFMFTNGLLEHIFPELAESEDERIRKKVIDVLKLNVRGAESQMQASRGIDRTFEVYACNKVIAWLEKQGEQNRYTPVFTFDDVLALQCAMANAKDSDEKLYHALQSLHDRVHDAYSDEKQGGQKPVECSEDNWSEEDERMYKAISIALSLKDAKGYLSSWYTTPEEADNWLLSIKDRVQPQPKQEWTEEDEAAISRVISIVKWAAYSDHSHPILNDKGATELVERLNSLKDRYAFKPSEEQMDALLYIFRHYVPTTTDKLAWDALQTLEFMLVQLKEIKGGKSYEK